MADGLCSGDPVGDVIEKKTIASKNCGGDLMSCASATVSPFYSDSDKLFDKLCDGERTTTATEGFLHEDDCRKKRCVDRYDSSESSDSGVAVLSCTDCSGSSTASSDITDPGSPFSTASTHSEDSASQPATKMPPTQNAHHPPWPWTAEEGPPIKRSMQIDKTALPKRLKSNEDNTTSSSKQSPPCLQLPSPNVAVANSAKKGTSAKKEHDNKANSNKQGKITEYFKSQIKLHMINNNKNKDNGKSCNINNNNVVISSNQNKSVLVDQQTQFNGMIRGVGGGIINNRSGFVNIINNNKKTEMMSSSNSSNNNNSNNKSRNKVTHQVTVPRKILPAPSKIPDNLTLSHHQQHHHQQQQHHHHHLNNMANFASTVTLTAVSFPPNLAYLHTKTPKPPDNIFVPQFATISSNDKISTIPIINRTPTCLNVIHQPVQKIATLNNFNCVKLNATVVPIVKLNTLPSRLNGAPPPPPTVPASSISVETAMPTVLSVKPRIEMTPKQVTIAAPSADPITIRIEEASKPDATEDKAASSGDSDSGVSLKDVLEVAVSEVSADPPQKSPILSQPKTIRFPPAKQQEVKEDSKDAKASLPQESGLCRWAECSAQFDTSGALLEHLQVKHVISQATQEQYVCLWLGCKVHGRTSCSRSWLERHVLAHAGTKPFRCIVDGCGQRFNSQLTLERHVNGHFNGDGSQTSSAKKSTENSNTKLFKRNGKRIRFRRQPWSARMFDFIDNGIMEGLQHKLLTITQDRTLGQINNPGDCVELVSRVMARRVEPDGRVKFLVRWHPADIIPDEWMLEKDYVATKSVPIPSLEPCAKTALHSRLFSSADATQKRTEKRRRKYTSKQQT